MADPELIEMIEMLFDTPDQALAVIGQGPMAASRQGRKASVDPAIPTTERLQMMALELRGQLSLLARQRREIDDTLSTARFEAEGLAVLVALRELWRHFPDVFSDTTGGDP